MALERYERQMVEAVRRSAKITISVNRGNGDEAMRLIFDSRHCDIRKLSHDIALSIQDYLNNAHKSSMGGGTNLWSANATIATVSRT